MSIFKNLKVRQFYPKTPQEYFNLALECYKNASNTIKSLKAENGIYRNIKKINEACGIAYIGVIRAIEGYMLLKEIKPKDFPKDINGYMRFLARIPKNGKLLGYMDAVYHILNINGYYRFGVGEIVIKVGLDSAKKIIEKLTNHKNNWSLAFTFL